MTRRNATSGFTLIEVLVSMAVGLIVTGAVMGLFSSGLQLLSRVEGKNRDMRVLDAAAQRILADPGIIWGETSLTMERLEGEPVVKVEAVKRERFETGALEELEDRGLYQVELSYGKTSIYMSLIIVDDDYKEKGSVRE